MRRWGGGGVGMKRGEDEEEGREEANLDGAEGWG